MPSAASDDPITEGFFDRHLHGPLAAWIVSRAPKPASDRQLTGAALVVGLTGAVGVLLATPHRPDWIFPAWLLFAFTVTARARRLTAAPDYTLELAVGAAFWTALTVRAGASVSWGCTLAALTLISAILQANLYARIRARFLAFTTEPDDAAAPAPEGLGEALSHDIAALLLGPEYLGVKPPRGATRSLLAGPMRMAAILSPGTHLTLVAAATALAVVDVNMSFGAVALAVAVGLNVWALLIISAWRRAELLVRRIVPV